MVVALLLQGVQAGLEILRLRLPRKDQMEALVKPTTQPIAMVVAVVALPQLEETDQPVPRILVARVALEPHRQFLVAVLPTQVVAVVTVVQTQALEAQVAAALVEQPRLIPSLVQPTLEAAAVVVRERHPAVQQAAPAS